MCSKFMGTDGRPAWGDEENSIRNLVGTMRQVSGDEYPEWFIRASLALLQCAPGLESEPWLRGN
jgi:hypothetical protein